MEEILIEEYNYPLPDERIAKYPLAQRDHSKLLVYRDGQVQEDVFHHIGQYLSSDSLLIYNNTRVIQARLEFHKAVGDEAIRQVGDKARGARIEIFCLEPLHPHDYQLALGATQGCTWKCMIGNAKKWKSGALSLTTTLSSGQEVTLFAEKGEQTGNTFAVHFSWNLTGVADLNISFAEILDAVGELPIPPYLNRKTEDSDKTTYQTVYSRIKGSVAAPTAGLHFTDQVLDGLRAQGVQTAEVTLHVGAGTFQPVKVANANDHTMHTEVIAVTKDTLIALRDHIGDIVAVGTTSMRTLESLYFIGDQLSKDRSSECEIRTLNSQLSTLNSQLSKDRSSECEIRTSNSQLSTLNSQLSKDRSSECEIRTLTVSQFAPYTQEYTLSTREALQAIVDYLDATGQDVLHAETQIMIKPGYEFRVVDKLITNFHQPKSTLLLLVSAFVSGDWHTIYDYALAHDFRFLSYGDSSILFRRNPAPNAAAPRC